jgi:long-chain fatty acid transport protein
MSKTIVMRALPAALLCLGTTCSFAAGFQLLEQNVSGLGNSYAGSAAVAEDASTVFFNPAGMAYLPAGQKSFVVGLNAIKPSSKFSNGASTPALLGLPSSTQPLGGNGGDAGSVGYVPNTYLVVPINPTISFGLGISAPFGLKTEYDGTWIGRFQAIKSDVKTININPSVSWKLNETVALGFGIDYQKLTGEFTSAANYSAAILNVAFVALPNGLGIPFPGGIAAANGLAALAGEGTAKITGSDTAWGYNFGGLFKVSDATRVGVSYRSAIKYHLTGSADFSRTGDPTVNAILSSGASTARGGAIYADIKLPDTFIVSNLTHLNDKWDMVGDLSWTGWSKIPDLTFKYASGAPKLSSTQEDWRDTWRVALGGTYHYNDITKIRFGLAYDQSPVKDQYRTPRLPDNNRTWISIGAQYALSKTSALDWGYAHLFVKDAPINNDATNAAGYGLLNGTYKDSVDIFGVQYAVTF